MLSSQIPFSISDLIFWLISFQPGHRKVLAKFVLHLRQNKTIILCTYRPQW